MRGRITLLFGLIFLVLATLVAERHADACAPAPPPDVHVAIAEESAIIVWDEATKTEHFIRRASFRSEAPSFGFLVPTPSKPELAEADDKAFSDLEEAIKPEVKRTKEWQFTPTAFSCFFLSRKAEHGQTAGVLLSPPPVRVIEAKRVGDYDAVILEADDAGALGEWLKSHGFAKQPALEEWLQPYVAKKWKLTAFKIADDVANAAADAGAGFGIKLSDSTFGTRAIRMSFKTDRPFFPYREPRDQRDSSMPASLSSSRSLRVFYVGPKRVDPLIGDGGATKFPGKIVWASPLAPMVLGKLPVDAPAGSWLTAIEDDSAPRPGVDELWLDPSKDQTIIKPPPIVQPIYQEIPIPFDILTIFALAIYFVVRRIKRNR